MDGPLAPASPVPIAPARDRSVRVVAVATEGRLRFRELRGLPGTPERSLAHAISLRLPDGAMVHVFGIGAVVSVGGDENESWQRDLEDALGRRLLTGTRERIVVEVGTETRVDGERVVVPRIDDATLDTIAFLLARSVALERYEARADAVLEDAHALASELAARARTAGGHTRQVKRVAALAGERLELARWFFPLDRPDWTWDDPAVARLYDALAQEFELVDRHEALLHKLASVEGTLRIVIELWESRRTRFLEWAIVLLIVLEIGLALVRVA